MQSGTILHLALLKKLSSNTPNCNYTHKFTHFRNNIRKRTHHQPILSASAVPLFQKYPSDHPQIPTFPHTSRSARTKIVRDSPKASDRQPEHICGWDVQNQDTFDALIRLKKKKSSRMTQAEDQMYFDENEEEEQRKERIRLKPNSNHHTRIAKQKAKQMLIIPQIVQTDPTEPVGNPFPTKQKTPLIQTNKENYARLHMKVGKEKSKQFVRTPRKHLGEPKFPLFGQRA